VIDDSAAVGGAQCTVGLLWSVPIKGMNWLSVVGMCMSSGCSAVQ
jgi:hypothetical protein